MSIDENASVYVLYAGEDPKVKKVVDDIKVMLDEKGIEGFDYQDRDVVDKPDRKKEHDTMDGLYKAIGNGRVIIMHLDMHYLKSKFCLNEISVIVQQSLNDSHIKERVVPIVHNREIIDKLYDEKEHSKLRKVVENTVKKYIKENKKILTPDDIVKLNNYPIDAEKFFKILADIRYQSIEYEENEETRKNIDNKLSAKTIDLQKYLKEEKERIEEDVKANQATNWYLPRIFIFMIVIGVFMLLGFAYSIWKTQELSNKIDVKRDKQQQKDISDNSDKSKPPAKEYDDEDKLLSLSSEEFHAAIRFKIENIKSLIKKKKWTKAKDDLNTVLKYEYKHTLKNRADIYEQLLKIVMCQHLFRQGTLKIPS